MILAKVIKRVIATAKLEAIPERALLSVEPLPGFGEATSQIIAIDTVAAGPGDTVILLQEGTGAREAVFSNTKKSLPAQAVIVGIVDDIF